MVIRFYSFLAVILNILIYFVFGSLITGRLQKRRFSATLSVITGFFLYYVLFELICIPMTLSFRPLHFLSSIWAGVLVLAFIISAAVNHKKWRVLLRESLGFIKAHPFFSLFLLILTATEIIIIVGCYQFTLDASFYVGTANTSLVTDSMNIYNPYTGMWQDHFEMRYFFANYAINDAVMCYLTGFHPLVWTKTVMETVVIILVNMVIYRIGMALFKGEPGKTGVFMFFAIYISFFFSTIYTAQEFFITRTYEGKTLIGSLVIPLIFLVYIKLLEDPGYPFYWGLLLLMSVGSLVLSNSASMIFPAALGIFMLTLFFIKKDFRILIKTALVVLPCVLSILSYVLYVKGYYVIHTMPG